jgi:serine/threonine protein kinase
MIAFPCEHCRRTLKVKDDMAGKKGKCPHCGQPMRVPATVPGGVSHDAATLLPNAPFAATRAPSPAPFDTQALADDASHPPAGSASAEAVSVLAPPQQPGELGRLGPYRVLGVLGQGGMGVVYKAEDPHLERPVALKAMLPAFGASPEARQRFLREAKAAAAVNHDHVVTIYQVGEDRGVPFLAMEFLEGEPLDARLKRVPRPPLEEVLRIARETAEGLAAAHEKGLIHRDIKPANIWLEGSRRRVKILDFGLARGGSGQDQAQLTQTGAIMGTPAFMAPEQARGETVDARCDLFSLGCVLYRMCSGELPFKGNDPISTLMAVATVTPPALSTLNADVPPALSKLVSRLLAKNREDRPASAHKVAEELAALERSLAAEAPTARVSIPPSRSGKETVSLRRQKAAASSPSPPRPTGRRAWLPLVGVAVGVIVVIAGGILAWQILSPGPKTEDGEKGKAALAAPNATGGFFNGKDLSGWDYLPEYWSVKDGAIVGAAPAGLKFNTFLCSKKKYRNFELKCQVRLRGPKANSGVQFRSEVIDTTNWVVRGPQADMGDGFWGNLHGERSGGLIKAAPPETVAPFLKPNEFNDVFIRCVGKQVTIKLNGVTTVDEYVATLPDEGIIAWQMHTGTSLEVVFRNIEFTELPASSA